MSSPGQWFQDDGQLLNEQLLSYSESCDDPAGILHQGSQDQSASTDAVVHRIEKRSKRPRSCTGKSKVWDHFTKIVTKDPEVVYAVCHCCDRMFRAHSRKDGTSHLRRHAEKCSRGKHLQQCYPEQVLYHPMINNSRWEEQHYGGGLGQPMMEASDADLFGMQEFQEIFLGF
uniref:BED-type domain-containing protein n=1 Tax=Leersia perrieri TaxID=77586 RepID=A0A0D9XIA7_9ORYZ